MTTGKLGAVALGFRAATAAKSQAELPTRRASHQPRRKRVLESIQAMSLLTIMEVVGPVLLLAILIYGTLQWSRRRRGPTQAVGEASTRQLYREGDKAEKREEGVVPGTPTSRPPRQR